MMTTQHTVRSAAEPRSGLPTWLWLLFLVLALAIGAAVGGCSSTDEGGPDVGAVHSSGLAQPASTAPSSTPSQPARSPRGNLVKQLGEPAGFCADVACKEGFAATFTVDTIKADAKCTGEYSDQIKPSNGHFIAVTLTVKTTDKFTQEHAAAVSFSSFWWSIVGPDGVTESNLDGGWGCLKDSEQLRSDRLSPASQYQGTVLLDAKNTAGVLVLRPPFMTDGGWEWVF